MAKIGGNVVMNKLWKSVFVKQWRETVINRELWITVKTSGKAVFRETADWG
jgi:hypothetical protein